MWDCLGVGLCQWMSRFASALSAVLIAFVNPGGLLQPHPETGSVLYSAELSPPCVC